MAHIRIFDIHVYVIQWNPLYIELNLCKEDTSFTNDILVMVPAYIQCSKLHKTTEDTN